MKKNTLVEVQGIEYSSTGYPRLVTPQGYLTARKDIVSAAISNIDSYYTSNPNSVKLLVNDYYYKDLEFKVSDGAIKRGSVVNVQAIEYSSTGFPRLKTEKGYITANKTYVDKVN
ncbi:ABC transporter, periplasmic spermidine putrescine-binding protein PotD [Enterococcus faecalis FL2]|nr:ABC transporter, periplasmic spermidine putrescine-binding protein PotD [Enterococcus faecalis FL2]